MHAPLASGDEAPEKYRLDLWEWTDILARNAPVLAVAYQRLIERPA